METVVAASFGANAGGNLYLLEGWARSEEKFTWTAAEQCTIRLPNLRGDGRFIVRLVASPFVVKQRLPVQRVELLMDDVRVGACELRDISVIEAEVPSELLGDDNRLTVTLRLPTAARPNLVSESQDDRLLALAVRSMMVIRVAA
jgi:hypothetical protein